ncbi:MAG: PH domain-containing protein [Bacteroidaceae bacterium]|nr:PH domain-containing protein [Bacteroidaceae bacterium]
MDFMHRTFKGKITPGMIFLYLLILGLTFFFAFEKNITAVPGVLLTIFCGERIFHTEYIITSSGNLIVKKGRFSKDIIISVKEISYIEKGESFYTKIGLFSYLNIILEKSKEISVWPSDEEGFLNYINKKHDKIIEEEE